MSKQDPNQLVFEAFPLEAQLDTQEKLVALRDDQMAGFLPYTHTEKNQAVEMLDYLGNRREYPAGLGNRLQEIFMRNKRDFGPNEARRALYSLAYEYGDYALNAREQCEALADLITQLNDGHFNPGVSVAEDFPDGHAAIPAVVRYVDVLAAREQPVLVTPYDPLKALQVRTVARNSEDDERHKTTYDRYTTPDAPAEVVQRIDTFMETTTIAQFRPVVRQAAVNEARRFEFWLGRVKDTRTHNAAWVIGRQLVPILEAPQLA